MKSKLFLSLLLSFLMINVIVGQERTTSSLPHRRSYVIKIDKNKLYYKETGQKIPYSEFDKIVEDRPGTFLEKETDDEGNLIRYLYDPNNQNGDGGMKLLKSYISDNIPFPNFRISTINGEKIELNDLNGKLVILRFESDTRNFQYNMPWIEKLDEKINALNNKEEVEAIIILEASEDDVRKHINLANSNFKLVADGLKIKEKYFIKQTPLTILIGQNGKLIGLYRNINEIRLEDHLRN